MTILYIPRTALACAGCTFEFVVPANLACPRCGEAVQFIADPHHETFSSLTGAAAMAVPVPPAGLVGQGGSAASRLGRHPDEGARWAVVFGLLVCVALFVSCIWFSGFIHQLLQAGEMDQVLIFQAVRVLLLIISAWGIFKGVDSLVNWSSGFRVYRKMRFPD